MTDDEFNNAKLNGLVTNLVGILLARKGFDDWWYEILEVDRKDIENELFNEVEDFIYNNIQFYTE